MTGTRLALVVAALGALAALGVAIGSERWGGLVPCALCLLERWPYRIAAILAFLCLTLPQGWRRGGIIAVFLCFLASAGLAGLHVGVEQGAWPSPLPECAAPNVSGLSMAERLRRMPSRPSKACEDPTRLIEAVPVSMAQLNFVYALVFSALLASFVWHTRRSDMR